jgi:signal transduction histidine kinase
MDASPTLTRPAPASATEPMPALGLPRVATVIAVAAWGIAVAAVCLLVAAQPPIDESLWFFLVDVTVAAVYGTVAGVTLSRRQHPVPWILAVTALGGGLAAFGYAWFAFAFTHPGMPELAAVARLQGTAWVPGTMALFVVVPWLVRDHPLGWEVVGLAAGAAMVGVGFGQEVLLDGRWDETIYRIDIVLGLVTAAVVEWRHRYGPAAERNGLGWVALGTLVLALSFVPLVLPAGWWEFPLATTPLMHLTSQALFPAAILVAVLRGRMWGLGLVVSRATLSGVLTMALLGLYLLVSLLMARLVPGEGGAQLVGAAVVAVAVQPARLWLGVRVDRLVHGSAAADPTRLVRRLGSQLGLSGTAEDLLAGLARDIGTGMRLESVTLRADGLPDISWGEPTSAPTYVPLQHRGEVVGELGATAPPGESLGTRGRELLADFGAVAASALAVVHQARQVEEAQRRLTRARLEERRVIRREIHDGLGPSLAGLRLGLQGARNLLATDQRAAAELLGTLQHELDQRVDAVRSLSHSLLPPVLDELGLGAALEELAARHREGGLDVELVADVPADLPAPLAAAAYGIASEAMANVARHSGAGRARIVAAIGDDRLHLEVHDDGVGVGADARPGVGSRSMHERADEQGGHVEVGPAPGGGTVVRAVLPVEAARG